MTQLQAFEQYVEHAIQSGHDADLYAVRDYEDGYRTVMIGGSANPLIDGEITSIILTYVDENGGFQYLIPDDLSCPNTRLIVSRPDHSPSNRSRSRETWGTEEVVPEFDRLLGKGTGKPVLPNRPELWSVLGKGFTGAQT